MILVKCTCIRFCDQKIKTVFYLNHFLILNCFSCNRGEKIMKLLQINLGHNGYSELDLTMGSTVMNYYWKVQSHTGNISLQVNRILYFLVQNSKHKVVWCIKSHLFWLGTTNLKCKLRRSRENIFIMIQSFLKVSSHCDVLLLPLGRGNNALCFWTMLTISSWDTLTAKLF